jgi:hypothetical protein
MTSTRRFAGRVVVVVLAICALPPFPPAMLGDDGAAAPATAAQTRATAVTRPSTAPTTRARALVVPDVRALLAKPQNPVRAIVQRYEADRASLDRGYTDSWSPVRRARLKLLLGGWLDELERLDAGKYGAEGRAENDKFRERLRGEVKQLDREAAAQAELAPLIPFAPVILDLEESRRRLESIDAQKSAGTLAQLKKQIDQARGVVLTKPGADAAQIDKALAARAADAVGTLRIVLKAWFGFYNDYDPMFTWWATQAYTDADKALGEYAALLKEKPVFLPPKENAPPPSPDVQIKLADKAPQVPDLDELASLRQSELREIIQAYTGRGGGGGRRGGGGGGGPATRQSAEPELLTPTRGEGGDTAATRPTGPPRQYYADWLAALGKLDFDALGREGQVDYVLLRTRIETDLRRAELRDNPPAVPRLQDASGITGRPIGREGIAIELAAEMLPYAPEDLINIAEREYAWCEAEMKRASREMGLGDDWKAAVERVKQMYVPPGKQPDLIRDLAWEGVEYVEDNGLVTVPQIARESWRMQMMSPQRQLINPFFTGGEVISVSYPTSGMAYDAKLQSMRGNNIPFSRATVFHELIPGHHLQQFMNSRYRTHRRPFNTPFWGEGWALYWEMLLYDRGFPKTPEHRVGMLFWRMHRCARIVFSLGFHTGKMSPAQCIDYLVERVGHERDNATAEVRRSFAGGYGPLYQAAYMVGGLEFRALHKELVDSGKMTDRAFHDAILKENSMPVAMVRAILTNQKLTPDYKSQWRFYDANR